MPINEKIIFDESQALQAMINLEHGMDNVIRKKEELNKQFKKSIESGNGTTSKMKKETEEVAKEIDNLSKKERELKKANDELKASFKSAADETKIFGISVGGTITQMRNQIRELKNLRDNLKTAATGFKNLKVVIGTGFGIGIAIAALSSLISYFTRTQKGIDAVNRTLAGFRSIIDNVVDRVAKFGGGIVELFKGNPVKAFNEIRESLSGVGKELVDDFKAASNLTKATQDLRDAQLKLNDEYSAARAKIKEYNLIAEDTTKTLAERESAAKKALELEQSFLERNKELAEEDLRILQERNSLSNDLFEDKQAVSEATQKLNELEEASLEQQTTLNNKLNAIRKEGAAAAIQQREAAKKALEEEKEAIRQLTEEYNDIIDEISQRIEDAELNRLTGVERLRAEKDLALAEIDILENRAKAAAEAAGIAYEAEKQFYELRQQIIRDFQSQVDEGRGDTSIIPKLEPAKIKAEGEKTGITYGEGMRDKIEEAISQGSSNPFEKLRELLLDTLDIDDQQLQGLVSGLQDSFAIIKDNIQQNLDLQLDANEKLLDSIRSQTESVEDELERQLELKSQGFANDVSLNQKKLAQLEKDEKKALEEQKKLQKQKNAIDTTQQISSLVSASASIFQSFAPLGPFGVALAIAAIGTMFGTFAATKIRAGRAARAFKGGPLGNYLGGDRSGGFIAPGGASDIPGRGDGYRIEGTNMRVGGDEFIVSEGPAREHGKFLKKLNKGAYRGFRFDKLFIPDHRATVVQFEDRESKIQEAVQRRQENLQRTAIENGIIKAVRENTQQIVGALDRQKHVTYLNEKIRSVVSEGGSVIEIIEKVG